MRKLLLASCLVWSLFLPAAAPAQGALSRLMDSDLFSSDLLDHTITAASDALLSAWDDAGTAVQAIDPADPLEKYNRFMFSFNTKLDTLALKPLAESYSEYTPDLLRHGVRNFFGNIGDVSSAANSALQGKVDQALTDSSRVAINSIVGLGGVLDVASMLDIQASDEDFGQTLAVWGVPEGPYVVLPLLGPKTLRSAVGTVVDTYVQLETLGSITEVAGAESAVSQLLALNLVDQRTRLLGKGALLEKAALDPYVFAREAYLAYRRCQVKDCDQIDYVPATPEAGSGDSRADLTLDELDELDQLDELDELDLLDELDTPAK